MQLINKETGEVYEIADTTEADKKMELLVTDELLDNLTKIEYLQEQIDLWKYKNKEAIKQIFKEYGIKSFKNNYITITYVEETERKSVDTAKLKRAGLYDEFAKTTKVADSLRISVRKD